MDLAEFTEWTRARIGQEADGWLTALPSLIAEVTEAWGLQDLGEPFDGGYLGYTVPARRGSDEVVLKIGYPDGWFIEEAAALAAWGGRGAVRLLESDPRGAHLLERAIPGRTLLEEPDEEAALDTAAGVLGTLWVPDPGGITTVATETLAWAASMGRRHDELGRPFERVLIHEAMTAIRELVPTQKEKVLLHGDLHMGNVLSASREPWLAIDPKPLIGERAFDVTALIRDKRDELVADPDSGRERVQRRFDQLAGRLGLDRVRLKRWSVAIMVDYALGDWEEGFADEGERQIEVARMLNGLRV
jgi:streptomycin 6-kinase